MRTAGYVDPRGTVRCDRCARFMGLAKGSAILADDLAYEAETCADCHRPLSMLARVPYLASRAAWHVKTAHAVALALVGASLAFGAPAHAASKADLFPLAPVAEVESHAWTVGVRRACLADVRTLDDGTVTVALRGAATTFPHGYGSESAGIADMVRRFGRDC